MKKTFKIFTFGCKTNQMESAVITELMIEAGYELFDGENVDVTVVNSCTVTSKTDSEILYKIRKIKEKNPDTKMVLTGCLSQVMKDELAQNPYIDIIMGNTEKFQIAEIVEKSSEKLCVSDIMAEKEFILHEIKKSGKTRVNLKIQDGCNNRCAYCIIPYARGNNRSSKQEDVLHNVKTLVSEGYKEIVLTGIHLGQWGQDFSPKKRFIDILKKIEEIPDLQRYRLGSLDPTELDDEMIEFLTNSKKVCNHFHISLQSANNKTLKEMNRLYKIENYIDVVQKLTSKIPQTAIGSDVIVGFPNETDEDFEITYENLKALPISYLHIFPYSKRKGTPAATAKNQVQDSVRTERAKKLKTLSLEKKENFIKSLIGTTQNVLVEENTGKAKTLKGLTSNYLSVLINGVQPTPNTIVKVKLTDYKNSLIYGELQ